MIPNTTKSVNVLLLSGKTPDAVHKMTGLPQDLINTTAKEIGWLETWEVVDHHSMVFSIKRLAIEGQLNLREIGEIHGLSRERVRQILQVHDINIKSLREKRLKLLSNKIVGVLDSGQYKDEQAANILDINASTYHRAKSLISKFKLKKIDQSVLDRKREKDTEYMATAVSMWSEHKVSEIAIEYKTSVAYMNQLIMKYRKIYGWFPHKRKVLKQMES